MQRPKMQELSERELLLLLNQKVDRLEAEISAYKAQGDKINQLEMKLARQEERMKIWGTIIAGIASLASSILTKILQ